MKYESKGRPSENKIPTVVVYRKPTGKKYCMLVTESDIDTIIDASKRKPILPNNYEIVEIGIGESFIEKYKKQYNIK